MKSALLGIAAASIAAFTFSATPASAGDSGGFVTSGFVGGGFIGTAPTSGAFPAVPRNQGWGVRSRPGFGFGDHRRHHDGDGDHRRHHRDDGDVFVGGFYDSGAWAYYNNRSWEQDSFNGWWHDDPDRAYPAWVRRNQQHCDRMWWSGDTLVC